MAADLIVSPDVFAALKLGALWSGQRFKCRGFSLITDTGFIVRQSPNLKEREVVANTELGKKYLAERNNQDEQTII